MNPFLQDPSQLDVLLIHDLKVEASIVGTKQELLLLISVTD